MKTTLRTLTFEDVPEARAIRSLDDLEVIGPEAEQHRIAGPEPILTPDLELLPECADRHALVRLDCGDSAGHEVRVPHETRHEGRRRMPVDVGRRPELGDVAQVHDDDRIGEGERLALVVRHHHHRLPGALLNVRDDVLQLVAQLRIERAEGLVEQEDRGIGRQGSGDHDALRLATRQLGREAIVKAGPAGRVRSSPRHAARPRPSAPCAA